MLSSPCLYISYDACMVTIYCDEHAIQKIDPSNPKEVKVSLRSDSMNEDFSSEMFRSVKISMGMYGHGSCMPWVCNFVLTLSEVCFFLQVIMFQFRMCARVFMFSC